MFEERLENVLGKGLCWTKNEGAQMEAQEVHDPPCDDQPFRSVEPLK